MGFFMFVLAYLIFMFALLSLFNRLEEERCYGCANQKFRDLGIDSCVPLNMFTSNCPDWEAEGKELVSYEVVALKPTQEEIEKCKHLSDEEAAIELGEVLIQKENGCGLKK